MKKNNQLRIKLKAYNKTLLVHSCKTIKETIKRTDAKIIGPISLPTKRKIYCVLRSPHVDKDSREHFEIRTHSKILDVYNTSSQTIDALMKLSIPPGVDIEIKL